MTLLAGLTLAITALLVASFSEIAGWIIVILGAPIVYYLWLKETQNRE